MTQDCADLGYIGMVEDLSSKWIVMRLSPLSSRSHRQDGEVVTRWGLILRRGVNFSKRLDNKT